MIDPVNDTGVFLIGFGGPTKPDEVRPFIVHVLNGRPVPAERIDDVVHHYEQLGGKSPYNELTFRQGKSLRRLLKEQGCAWPVYAGFRHAAPFFEETLQAMAADGIRHARGIILAPHQCESSDGRYRVAVEQARAHVHGAPAIEYVAPWFDHPLLIEAVADRVQAAISPWTPEERAAAAWLFLAHSIPVAMADASPYVAQFTRSARLVADRLQHQQWSVAYQSRSGRPQDPWLEPSIDTELRRLATAGIRHVVAIPIGFITDHVEVLYDLDVEAQAVARALGLTLARAGTVGDHPAFVRMMADVLRADRVLDSATSGGVE